MTKDNCIFCKIIEGVIPAHKIYEDELFISFLDINPVKKGHSLIIPKNHVEWMHQADNATISNIFILTKKIMSNIIEKLPCDYVQVSVVGKDVPHFHIHLIPRTYDDGLNGWPALKYSDDELQKFQDKLKM